MREIIRKHRKAAIAVAAALVAVVVGVILLVNIVGNKVYVSFVTEGSPVETIKMKRGDCVSEYPVSNRVGYSFQGWYTDAGFTTPWYLDDPVEEDLAVYAYFKETDTGFEEFSSNILYQEEIPANVEIGITSSEDISEKDFLSRISFTTEYGEEPNLLVRKQNGVYYISAENGFYRGGAYTVKLPEGMKFDGMEDHIGTYSFRVLKEEVQNVELNADIKYISTDEIFWEPDNGLFRASGEIMDKYGISLGDVLCISDNPNELVGTVAFVKVEAINDVGEPLIVVSVSESEIADVYRDIDVCIRQQLTSGDVDGLIDLAAIEQAVYDSSCLEDMTFFLANALGADKTYNELILLASKDETIDEYDFSKNVSPRTTPVEADFDELLRGVSVSVTTAMVDNKNFSIPNEKNWTAISIKFTYDTTLRQKVKIHAELELVESVNISAQGYIENKSDLENLNFDYALNIYTQTDLKGTILVSSTSAANEAKSGWINITDEISALMSGEDDSAPDTLVARMQEMLDAQGDYVKLLEVPVMWVKVPIPPVLPVFQVNIDVNLVVRVNFAAGLSSNLSVLDSTQVGIRGSVKDKSVKGYTHTLAEGGRYSYNLAACGYVGLRAGVEGELTLSLVGLDSLGKIGAAIEVGAYTDLYGYADMSVVKRYTSGSARTTVRGGYYMEVGIYGTMSLVAESEVFKVQAGYTLLDIQVPLFTLGHKNLLLSMEKTDGIFYMHKDHTNITEVVAIPARYMDLTTGGISEGTLKSDTKLNGMVTNKSFRYDSNTGVISYIRDPFDRRLTAETEIYLYYDGPNLIFSDSQIKDEGAFIGKFTIRWIAPEADIKDEDFGKPVSANYYVDVYGEKILLGTRMVEIGTVPGIWDQWDGTYSISGEWDINPGYPIDKDTDFVMKASPRSVLVGTAWFDKDEWQLEIRAVDCGEVPQLPDMSEVEKLGKFKGWKVTYGDYVYDNYKTDNGLVKEATEVPKGCFKFEEYINFAVENNELLYSVRDWCTNNVWVSFAARKHATPDGNEFGRSSLFALYVAEYEDCEVTAYSKNKTASGRETVDYSGTNTVPFGTSLSRIDYKVPFWMDFLGWDTDGDGAADLSGNAHVTSDMTVTAVYDDKMADVTAMYFDPVSGEYTPVEYSLYERTYIPRTIFDNLLSPEAPFGYLASFKYWEISNLYTGYTTSTIELGYPFDNMTIKPVFENLLLFRFDAEGGYITEGPTGSAYYNRGDTVTIPKAVIREDEEYNMVTTTWLDQDGISYEAGTEVVLTKPLILTPQYTKEPRIVKAEARVETEVGVLPNGQTTYSFEGTYAEYRDFIELIKNYEYEDIETEGYVYRYSPSWTKEYTLMGIEATEIDIVVSWFGTPKTYSVHLDAAGGHFFGTNVTATLESYYGQEYSISRIAEIEPVTRESDLYEYTLKGWTDADGTFYGMDDTCIIKGEMTLTAVWESKRIERTCRIYIEGDLIAEDKVVIGERIDLEKLLAESRYSGREVNWSTDSDTTIYKDTYGSYVLMPSTDLTIEGTFAGYTLTFDPGDGYFTGGEKTVTVSVTADSFYSLWNAVYLADLTKDETDDYTYELTGWRDSNGTYYDANAYVRITSDRSFSAVWEAIRKAPAHTDEHTYYIYIDGAFASSGTAKTGDKIFLDPMAYGWTSSPSTDFGKDDVGGRYAVMPDCDIDIYGYTN